MQISHSEWLMLFSSCLSVWHIQTDRNQQVFVLLASSLHHTETVTPTVPTAASHTLLQPQQLGPSNQKCAELCWSCVLWQWQSQHPICLTLWLELGLFEVRPSHGEKTRGIFLNLVDPGINQEGCFISSSEKVWTRVTPSSLYEPVQIQTFPAKTNSFIHATAYRSVSMK